MTSYINLDKEISELCRNSQAYIKQLKENILSSVRKKLESFECQFSQEIHDQFIYFKGLYGDIEIKESYENLKYQIRAKIEKMKQLYDQIDVFQISSKLTLLNPMQEQPKGLNLDRFNPQANNLDLEFLDTGIKRKDSSRKLINYNCPICKKSLTSSCSARTHIRFIHGIEKHLFCPHIDCSFAVGQSKVLARHLIQIHGFPSARRNFQRYKCFYTGDIFRSKNELKYHISSCEGYLNRPAHSQDIENKKIQEFIGLSE